VEILVDTSIWIDYFRSGDNSEKLDYLIDNNLVVTNDLILTELLPLLVIRNEKLVVRLLKKLRIIQLM
jgi:predicted nucleic acid-binding protein